MKKYLLGLFAVVLAVGFSAFTMKKVEAPKQSVRYAVFTPINTTVGEKVFSNYTLQATPPAAALCPSNVFVCWVRLTDTNSDGLINQTDFTNIVNALDTDSDGIISDNQVENGVSYEEKVN